MKRISFRSFSYTIDTDCAFFYIDQDCIVTRGADQFGQNLLSQVQERLFEEKKYISCSFSRYNFDRVLIEIVPQFSYLKLCSRHKTFSSEYSMIM